jgi:23S rRNA (cytidine1920-2'-O)/16S rRNA (cytidine1409-2'-O)-methyltransferase
MTKKRATHQSQSDSRMALESDTTRSATPIGKDRIDKLLVLRGLCQTRQQAQSYILAGQVLVGDLCVDKAGTQIPITADIRLRGTPLPYVSRAGSKLAAALDAFEFDVADKLVLDLGSSTGGFCDCLLQRGCRKVLAVDVGYGQLHPKLATDLRVVVIDRTNARHLQRQMLPLDNSEEIDLITSDLSFISLRLVLPAIASLLSDTGDAILLVKPQFEVGRQYLDKGIVRDAKLRQQAADMVSQHAALLGLHERARLDSPVHGPKGNIEILMWLHRRP